ncbi:9053_t:CDS:2, partial [Cetraspora pellucida]
MDIKQEREAIVKTVLRNECDNYLYEYLIQREEQASFTEDMRSEHDGYIAELRKLINDSELGDKAKIAWDTFEAYGKKAQVVFNFWDEIQKFREEETALTQYARAQEESSEGVSLPVRRKREYKNCDTNVKKIRVDGQDSQLDDDSELTSAFEDETNCTTIGPSISTNDNNNKSSELIPYSDNQDFEDDLEEIDLDLAKLSKELECEPTVKWAVGCINVSDRFRQYQKEVFKKAVRRSLKHANIYEILALSSILVLCWPCPYPIFTNREWREIMSTNPYAMNKPPLPQEISSSLREAASRRLSRGDVFMECGNSDLNRLVALMFNNLYYGIPEVVPPKLSEEEHCDMFIYPIARSFRRSEKEYELRLNRTTTGSKSRPDLSCVVNDISILNSEFKPLGCTPLQEKKDRLKAHLKSRKSINQQLERKGGPAESVIFLNI